MSFLPLILYSPIDGVAINNNIIWRHLETLDHANCVRFHFFNLPPYAEREKNHLNVACCFFRWRESNPSHLHSKRVRYPLLQRLSAMQNGVEIERKAPLTKNDLSQHPFCFVSNLSRLRRRRQVWKPFEKRIYLRYKNKAGKALRC